MRKRLIRALARLGSLPYQEAYIMNGTASEYAIPEDITEEAASLSAQALQNDHADLSNGQVDGLKRVLLFIRENGKKIFTNERTESAKKLVLDNELWAALRDLSRDALREFDVDVDSMDFTHIDDL